MDTAYPCVYIVWILNIHIFLEPLTASMAGYHSKLTITDSYKLFPLLARSLPYGLCKKTTPKESETMKKIMIVLTALLLVTAFVMPADAMRGGGKGHGYGFCNGNDLSSVPGLNLTAEQKTKISDLRTAYMKDIKPLQDKMHSKAGDLRLLWLEKTPDEAKIRATEKEIRALRDQMQDKSTDYRWAIYKVLTPEQQALLKENKATGRCFGPGPGAGKGMGPGKGSGMAPGAGPGMGQGMGGNMR
jgi:Spy/CpxP family protein refolding chaperone